uniref:Uncharacterized protein n=1 Tax=Bactrocera dorsalis TaxID=27457 RepID=A0A034VM19_BACDO
MCALQTPKHLQQLEQHKRSKTTTTSQQYSLQQCVYMYLRFFLFESRDHLVRQLAALWFNNNSTASMERCSLFCPLFVCYALFCYLRSCFVFDWALLVYFITIYLICLYLYGDVVAGVTAFVPALFDRLLLLLSLHKCLYVGSCLHMSVSVHSAIALRSISTP